MKLKIRDKDIQFIYYFFATMMVISMVAAVIKNFFSMQTSLTYLHFIPFLS